MTIMKQLQRFGVDARPLNLSPFEIPFSYKEYWKVKPKKAFQVGDYVIVLGEVEMCYYDAGLFTKSENVLVIYDAGNPEYFPYRVVYPPSTLIACVTLYGILDRWGYLPYLRRWAHKKFFSVRFDDDGSDTLRVRLVFCNNGKEFWSSEFRFDLQRRGLLKSFERFRKEFEANIGIEVLDRID